MKNLGLIFLLALSAGCASTGSPPPSRGQSAPTATPTLADPIVVPTPTPVPTPVPTGPVPVVADIGVGSAPIRVLLKKTADVMTFPQPGRAYRTEVGDEAVWLWGPLEITSSGEVAWQVGAWSSSEAATSVSDALARQLGDGARVWQESASENLVRVRVRWPGGEPTDAKAQLAAA